MLIFFHDVQHVVKTVILFLLESHGEFGISVHAGEEGLDFVR